MLPFRFITSARDIPLRIDYSVGMSDVTQILGAIDRGDAQAAEKLLPLVYDELRRLASAKLAHEKPGQTLDATALVHEAYMRLVGNKSPGVATPGREFANRAHFFSAAAEAMRRILVESARRKGRLKRAGDRKRLDWHNLPSVTELPPDDVLDLHDALVEFAAEDPIKAQLIQLRFFTGMSVEQAGECLGISRATADRYWAYARAWLHDRLQSISRAD